MIGFCFFLSFVLNLTVTRKLFFSVRLRRISIKTISFTIENNSYLLQSLQLFSQDYNLGSYTTHVVLPMLTYSLKSTLSDRFRIFSFVFAPDIFAGRFLKSCRRSIFISLCLTCGLNHEFVYKVVIQHTTY